MQVNYKDEVIHFAIDYGKRKYIKILIEYPGLVRVKAPKGTDEERIRELIVKHGDQIVTKLKEMSEGPRVLKEKNYTHGEVLLYLGREMELAIQVDESVDKPVVEVNHTQLRITCKVPQKEELKKAMEKFYRKQCRKKIMKRIAYYQPYFKVKPRQIEIINSNNIWGSCSSERNLRFNWRLMMAPEEAIDYIVVHEMSHLIHLNHSKSFWTLVGKTMPDYKERSNWLSVNGGQMEL